MSTLRECVQCEAKTKSGRRCKRRTCTTPAMCYQHTDIKDGLRVKKSTIPKAGKGLFATKRFRRGAKIANYTGVIKNRQAYEKDPTHGFGLALNRREVIDARSTQAGIARYANDCRRSNKRARNCKGNNARLSTNTRAKTGSIKALKTIKPGSEIFVNYGRDYWRDNKFIKQKR